jgi:ubiquinone/menaquinone biosynthesis C-methylase UbiE
MDNLAAYDLATRDKIRVVHELMAAEGAGRALDVGSGTGYTTTRVFGDRPTVCVDVDAANLRYVRERARPSGKRPPLGVVALATALPFRPGSFRYVLCSEVLEHLEDDGAAVAEIARVLAPGGRVVITVPYTGLGFTSFLEVLRVPTVHERPGPEHHVRPGYSEATMGALLRRHGLLVERWAWYLRVFTRLAADGVSLAHLLYQRVVHGRAAWTWAEAAQAEGGRAFALYQRAFPLLRAWGRLDALLRGRRGFGLVVAATRPAGDARPA